GMPRLLHHISVRYLLRDMEAMEALAWRIHQRMRKRYRNRVDARRKKQEALLNTLRACFGLKLV
ncbi:hypothetical protein DWV20_05670, partial [Collinsella sp. AF02-46-1]